MIASMLLGAAATGPRRNVNANIPIVGAGWLLFSEEGLATVQLVSSPAAD